MRALRLILPLALLPAACTQTQPLPPLVAPTSAPRLDGATGAAVNPQPPAPVPTPAATPTPAPTPTATPNPTTSPQSGATRFVAMGASDVVGLGANDPATEGWAPVLAKLLEKRLGRPLALTKVGALSRTAAEMKKFDLERAVAAKPQVAALWTGANDIRTGLSLDVFRADLDSVLDGLQGTGATLYVLNLPDLDRLPFFAEYKESYKAAMPHWQAAIREAGKAHGAVVIDLAAFSDEIAAHPEYLWFDGFHPSTVGYARLAAIVDGAIAKNPPRPAR